VGSSRAERGDDQLHVTLVSDNPETLDALEAYLRRAGVKTTATRDVDTMVEHTPLTSSVILIFPDDFPAASVRSALASLRSRRRNVLPVLVTKTPKQFESLALVDGAEVPLVIPRPAWAWTILDDIRARLRSEAG
jgi:DNA-binding response OmpR family regulator